MPLNFARTFRPSVVLALASGLVAATGTVAQAAPAADAGTDSTAQQSCSRRPGFVPERSPVPVRASIGFAEVKFWGNSCDQIALTRRDDGPAVRCQDGHESTNWFRLRDFSQSMAPEGWVSDCDIQQ